MHNYKLICEFDDFRLKNHIHGLPNLHITLPTKNLFSSICPISYFCKAFKLLLLNFSFFHINYIFWIQGRVVCFWLCCEIDTGLVLFRWISLYWEPEKDKSINKIRILNCWLDLEPLPAADLYENYWNSFCYEKKWISRVFFCLFGPENSCQACFKTCPVFIDLIAHYNKVNWNV